MIGLDIRFNVFSVILSVQIRGFDQKTLTKNMGGAKPENMGGLTNLILDLIYPK